MQETLNLAEGNLYETHGWKIYTPDDDPCVVVSEDPFSHKRTFDVDHFIMLMTALTSIQDY